MDASRFRRCLGRVRVWTQSARKHCVEEVIVATNVQAAMAEENGWKVEIN